MTRQWIKRNYFKYDFRFLKKCIKCNHGFFAEKKSIYQKHTCGECHIHLKTKRVYVKKEKNPCLNSVNSIYCLVD